VNLKFPLLLFSSIPIILAIWYMMRRTLVKFVNPADKQEFIKEKKSQRTIIMLLYVIIILFLAMALATPFGTKKVESKGEVQLKILFDNTTSYSVMDQMRVQTVKERLDKDIPVTFATLASGEQSALGDGVMNNLFRDENVLVVTDGRNNYGKSLQDVILFASALNSTVSVLKQEPIQDDAAVRIIGPEEAVIGTMNEFAIQVNTIGTPPYKLRVMIDNEVVLDTGGTSSKEYTVQRPLAEGYHKVSATLIADDFFEENNEFYKVVRVEPMPKVLLVTKSSTVLESILRDKYVLSTEFSLPRDISGYSAIVLNNIAASDLSKNDISRIADYLAEEGNGLLVVGGKSSFDVGGYDNSMLETLLPVSVGVASQNEGDVTSALVLVDISGSGGEVFMGQRVNVADVGKAIAIQVVDGMSKNDKVGVIAFNEKAHMVQPMEYKRNAPDITNKIASLEAQGGTVISQGLRAAYSFLSDAEGGKNIVVISDGMTQFPIDAYNVAVQASIDGIKVHAIQIGNDAYGKEVMSNIANYGKGLYLSQQDLSSLKVVLGTDDENEDENEVFDLIILDRFNWITQNLDVSGRVTGYNQVIPKSNARTLIATKGANPILTSWRFGLGRVAVISTSPDYWAPILVRKENSRLIPKTTNWVIGDLARNKEFLVEMSDARKGELATVNIISKKTITSDELAFTKVDEDKYKATFIPEKVGFNNLLNTPIAVNYQREYELLGFDESLGEIVSITGGSVFVPGEEEEIVKKIKSSATKLKLETVNQRTPWIIGGIIVYLISLLFRRMMENSNRYKYQKR